MPLLHHVNSTIASWRRRRFYRDELIRLQSTSQHLIRDLGLASEVVAAEVVKPAWRE